MDLGYLIGQFYVIAIVITSLSLATGRDERQALSAELLRSQETAVYEASVRDAVIGSITEGLIVVDESGELLVHNEAASVLLGAGDEPLTTDSQFALSSWSVDGAELNDADRPTARALRGETVHGAEVLIRVAGAPDRVLSISGIPLPRDEIRRRARALVIFRDVTSEHAHRQELSAFAGVVAHDLRNPLAAIDGWTEMIADELDDGGSLDPDLAREFVSRVRSSSRRMRELIRDLLAHATSGSRDLDVSQVDIGALVAEIGTARHAEKFVSCDPVPPVLADPILIRQVVDNLIGNALKYVGPDVEPAITVTRLALRLPAGHRPGRRQRDRDPAGGAGAHLRRVPPRPLPRLRGQRPRPVDRPPDHHPARRQHRGPREPGRSGLALRVHAAGVRRLATFIRRGEPVAVSERASWPRPSGCARPASTGAGTMVRPPGTISQVWSSSSRFAQAPARWRSLAYSRIRPRRSSETVEVLLRDHRNLGNATLTGRWPEVVAALGPSLSSSGRCRHGRMTSCPTH